ncbi:MAG: lanthionine synthetase LanC family protein [Candidatus Hodarchaeales archaeon]|jgi:lantibiotic modifying enzyme
MKMKNHKFFGISIGFLLLTSQITYSFTGSVTIDYQDEMTQEDLYNIALEIALGLQNYNHTVNTQVKWPRIVDNPPEGWPSGYYNYYYGYNWGAAGIADTFLSLYNASSKAAFLSIAEKAANFIINGAQIRGEGGLYWYTVEGRITQYIGMKYGNAGIAKFFLHLYQQTYNNAYLHYLNQSLILLVNEATINSQMAYWGYSLNGTEGVSDVIYGTAGICDILLEAGTFLNNTNWVELAIKGGNWLENISKVESRDDIEIMTVPWSNFSPFNTTFFTGQGSGNAGIATFFLKLYKSTGNTRWLDNAKRIGNWILLEKNDGSWINGGVGYSTEIEDNSTITGIDSGSAGIGKFFLDLFAVTEETIYANGAFDAAGWLIRNVNSSGIGLKWSKVTSGNTDNETYLTGLSYGSAGIGYFFSLMYKFFGCSKFKQAILGVATWLNSLRTDLGIFPVATGNTRLTTALTQYGHHLSYYDGSAGIALFFLKAAENFNSTILYPDFFSCDQLPSFSPTDPQSSRQTDSSDEIIFSVFAFFSISSLIVIAVIINSMKGKR